MIINFILRDIIQCYFILYCSQENGLSLCGLSQLTPVSFDILHIMCVCGYACEGMYLYKHLCTCVCVCVLACVCALKTFLLSVTRC